MAAGAILNLLFLSILVKRSISDGSWLHQMAAAAIIILVFVYYSGISACRSCMVIYMPNFVQICATVNEL